MSHSYGHYVGRNPRNAPAESDSDQGDEEDDVLRSFMPIEGGRKARIAAAKGHKAQLYQSLAEENAVLDAFIDELQPAKRRPYYGEDEVEEPEETAATLTAFQARLAAAAAAAAASASPGPSPTQATTTTPAERAIEAAVARLKKAVTHHPIPWPYDGPGLNLPSMREAQTKVGQMEAAIVLLEPREERDERLLWHVALRPPWPLIAGGTKPAPLVVLVRLFERRFGVSCAGLMALDAGQKRVALLSQRLVDDESCGLAFILSPANAGAKDLSRLPTGTGLPTVCIHTLSNMTREMRETTLWTYVGTLPVPAGMVDAARPARLFDMKI